MSGCQTIFNSMSELDNHLHQKHSYSCELCHQILRSKEQYEIHHELVHVHTCHVCFDVCVSREVLSIHYAQVHPNKCQYCDEITTSEHLLNIHIDNSHTYDCDACDFTGVGEDTLEDHILATHATADECNLFKCDDCQFKSYNKLNFGSHYKRFHGSGRNRNRLNTEANENVTQLKRNFERLEKLYKEALDEASTQKAEYEVKIANANEERTRAIANNEILQEKIEVLFKLGKSYLDNNKKLKERMENTATDSTDAINQNVDDENISVVSNEPDEVRKEGGWTTSKMRGFKRKQPNVDSPGEGESRSKLARSTTENPDASQEIRNSEHLNRQGEISSKRVCFYFSTTGTCKYEERTGLKCRYEHSRGSMPTLCRFGVNCSKARCTFMHPKLPQNWGEMQLFLEKIGNMSLINPWQNQVALNPWNHQGQQNATNLAPLRQPMVQRNHGEVMAERRGVGFSRN